MLTTCYAYFFQEGPLRPVLEYIDLVSSDDEEPSTSRSDVSTLYWICI